MTVRRFVAGLIVGLSGAAFLFVGYQEDLLIVTLAGLGLVVIAWILLFGVPGSSS